jgi:hypothetical protein
MQHVPKPPAHGPFAVPPFWLHSGAETQVPLSPVAPVHTWLLNWTKVKRDKTETGRRSQKIAAGSWHANGRREITKGSFGGFINTKKKCKTTKQTDEIKL